jgi:hypothetical protein
MTTQERAASSRLRDEEDAARYRWLRDHWLVPGFAWFPWGDIENAPRDAAEMDDRLDAAMVCQHPPKYRYQGETLYCRFCGEDVP